MSNRSNRPGTELTSSEIAAITSLDLLGTTPAGHHIAKNALGNFVNTPDTGGGTSYTFQNGVVESAGVVELGGSGALTSLNINGTAGNGHIHLKHQSTNPASQASSSTIFALASGRAGWINDGLGTETLAYLSDIPSGTAVNSVLATVDFGSTFNDKAVVVLTGLTWVSSSKKITAQLMTPVGVDPDEIRLLDFKIVISDVVDGVGFTVSVFSETEATGSYDIMCLSN